MSCVTTFHEVKENLQTVFFWFTKHTCTEPGNTINMMLCVFTLYASFHELKENYFRFTYYT